jgi:hypothetical protein
VVTLKPQPTAGLAECPDCDEPLIVPVTYRHITRTTVAIDLDLSQVREHMATHNTSVSTELPPTAR